MGRGLIEMPTDFKEAYIKAKAEFISDKELSRNHYYVDEKTLIKWKRAVGFKAGDFAENKKRRKIQ